MCFFCRNTINLDSFNVPYGKLGLQLEDYFYVNSVRATLRKELQKLINDKKNDDIIEKCASTIYSDIFNRIVSCGHYFHASCFEQGLNKDNDEEKEFTCPLCLKGQNILIPPLNRFQQKYNFFKSENLNELFNEQIDKKEEFKLDNDSELFQKNINSFLTSISLDIEQFKDYASFLDLKFPCYKSFFNFLENVFYVNGTTFHKRQQIFILQNIILSLRFAFKSNRTFFYEIIKYIQEELTNLAMGIKGKEYVYGQKDIYMHYSESFEKILLSLSILFNYDEMKETFKYILYIILPYFAFGFYYRNLVVKKELNIKEKMNMKDLRKYLMENNKQILDYLDVLLKKFYITKLVLNFKNNRDDILNSFNKLTLKNLLLIIDQNNIYGLFHKNENDEINFMDIFHIIPKIFYDTEIFYKLFKNYLNHNKVFESIFSSVKNNDNDEEKEIEKELIIPFTPIQFDFIHLDNNVFDWIERNLLKKCDICSKLTKYSYICLICGKKVCNSRDNRSHILEHTNICGKNNCLFVDMKSMKMVLCKYPIYIKKLNALYVNESGIGTDEYEIGKEFNLAHEQLYLALKNYVCFDSQFN
jgi:hypothetical protein